jgi:hypothetical protein
MNTRRASRKAFSVQHAMTSAKAMIDMHGIVKTFNNAAGEFTVLRGIDLRAMWSTSQYYAERASRFTVWRRGPEMPSRASAGR